MSRNINIRLRRTIVISLVLFSILLTSGELFLYKNSISRDIEHVGLVSAIKEAELAVLEAYIYAQDHFLDGSDSSGNDLKAQIKLVDDRLQKLDEHLRANRSALINTDVEDFISAFGTIMVNFKDLKKRISMEAGVQDDHEKRILGKFGVIRQDFSQLNSLVPGHISEDEKLYRTEILMVTILNAIIIILAGYAILRLAMNLEKAEQSLIIGTVEVENRERERIAADLHDGLGALLSGLIIHLQVLKKEYVEDRELLDKLEHVRVIAADALSGIEETIYNLNPPILTRFGLHGSLERLIKRMNSSGKTEFLLQSQISNKKFNQGTELLVFRICSELFNNTLKHANATTAVLEIESNRKGMRLSYSDNGEGFVYNLDDIKERKSGINNIIQRVESMNGQWTISTAVGLGVQVNINLPLARQ